MKAIIYHTKGCNKCQLTKRLLNMPVEMKLLDRENNVNSDIIQYMDSKGWYSAPLVRIYDDNGKKVDEWNDFKVDKVNQYR